MKYQNFAIIFVIILLPISMVLSYYIQTQTDTLTLQTNYQTKLNDSTYDAIAAYQLNSLNTQRISGESVKSYVLASVNTFFTTLATNMGISSASKQTLLPYVPAILFTTYDGYYIYSPLKVAKVVEDPDTGIALTTKEGNVIYYKNGTTANDSEINTIKTNQPNNTAIESSGKFTTNADEAKIEYNYMLKPFIYYSAEYRKDNDYDFVASYTLDNYVTLYGNKKVNRDNYSDNTSTNKYVTDDFSKSGYLINPDKIELGGNLLIKEVNRNSTQSNSEPSIDGDNTYGAVIQSNRDSSSITHNHVRYKNINLNTDAGKTEAYKFINYYYYGLTPFGRNEYSTSGYYPSRVTVNTGDNPIRYQTGDEIIESTLDINELVDKGTYTSTSIANDLTIEGTYSPITVKYDGIEITDREAKEYYIKAYFFSSWVQRNLNDVTVSSVQQKEIADRVNDDNFEYADFTGDNSTLFNINDTTNNPEVNDSLFASHKRDVIKNSIQYNLNTAISTYDATYYGDEVSTEFRLPILSNDDWESILNNVSMTSFLQGLPCGITTFNNYSVVKSNNNNTSVSLENLYFTREIGVDRQSNDYYHKYDCPNLPTNTEYEADISAEFKYDAKKINLKVESTTRNNTVICFYDDSTNTYYQIDRDKTLSSANVLAVGDEIPSNRITSYTGPKYEQDGSGWWRESGEVRGVDLTDLPNGSEVQYLYDHQNLGCYDCIISGLYTPVVKYYNGKLRRTFKTSDTEEMLIYLDNGEFVYENGAKYEGTPVGKFLLGDESNIPIVDNNPNLLNRRKAVYTAIAKHRQSLYKANDYVNR